MLDLSTALKTLPAAKAASLGAKLAQLDVAREREACEAQLLTFLEHSWPYVDNSDFQSCWAIEAMCDHLEAVTFGHIKRLLINVPPRCTKTTLCSVVFPAWTWMRSHKSYLSGPQVKFLCASYSHTLSLDASNRSRRLIGSPWCQKLWPNRIVFQQDQNAKHNYENTVGGARIATSVGGALLGIGGDLLICLPYDERVLTSSGWLRIGEVVSQRLPVRIAGMDDRKQVVWQDIQKYETNPGGRLVEITWSDGSLRCTDNHPVFVEEKGYVQAKDVQAGDTVLATNEVSGLRESIPYQQGSQEVLLPALLPFQHERNEARLSGAAQQSALCQLWEGTGEYSKWMEEVQQRESWAWAFLQSRLLWKVSDWCRQSRLARRLGFSCLSNLWSSLCCKAGSRQSWKGKVLFYAVPWYCTAKRKAFANLSFVSEAFSQYLAYLLFSPLCRSRTLTAHAGQREFELFGQDELSLPRRMDSIFAGGDSSARWLSLSSLWRNKEWQAQVSSTPCRLQSKEYSTGELDYALRHMSREYARPVRAESVAQKVVRSVKNCGYASTTYNVCVSPCHNYFAEGILVHNCDDLNNTESVESEAERETVGNFWQEFHSTRINNPNESAIIVIQQRLHEMDVSGMILKATEEAGEDWVHLCIPMRYDTSRSYVTVALPQYEDNVPYDDPRSDEGELMWPERFDEVAVRRLEMSLGPYLAAGRLQQLPVPKGGGIIQSAWWQNWTTEARSYGLEWNETLKEFPPMELVVGSLDTAYGEKDENNYSAMTVWGVWVDRSKNRRAMLMYAWAKRLPLHGRIPPAEPGEPKEVYTARKQKSFGLVELVADTAKRYKVERLLIENKTRGHDVANELRRLYARDNWGVEMTNPVKDKVARTHAVVPLFVDAAVWAPNTQWAQGVIDQCSSFPKGMNDDLHDTVTQFLNWARENMLLVRADEEGALRDDAMTYVPPRKGVAEAYGLQ